MASKQSSPTAEGLYQQLAYSRDHFLRTGRKCAALTLPLVLPPEGFSAGQSLPTPWQSVGARGVVNLAAKLLLALLPTNSPFFKLVIDAFELKKVADDPKLKTQLDEALSEIEQAVGVEVETSAVRVTAFEAVQHLVVTGNCLLEVPEKGSLKLYHLDRYVVMRDPMGDVLKIVIQETVAPAVLSPELQKQLGKDSKEKTVNIYTVCELDAGKWSVWQEIKGIEIPDSLATYPKDKCPFIPLRFNKVDGEDYGRGFVEQYLGDLTALDALSQALVEGSLAASKVLFLVVPGGLTNADRLAKASNGDFVAGREEDVKPLQLGKFADFQVTFNQATNIEKRLETAFLLMTSIQRQAERVTAEEIRALIQELEASLGGVYSVLAQDLQLPLANALMDRMAKQKRLPALPKKIVRATVTTGLEALGRGNDLQKLDAFLQGATQALGPQVASTYVQPGEYLARRATALGIDTKGLIKTDEEVAQATAQAQQMGSMQELATKLGPEAMRQMAQMRQGAAAPTQ